MMSLIHNVGSRMQNLEKNPNGSPQKDELQYSSILLLRPLSCSPSTLVRQRSPWSREFGCSTFWLKSSLIPAVSQVIVPSCSIMAQRDLSCMTSFIFQILLPTCWCSGLLLTTLPLSNMKCEWWPTNSLIREDQKCAWGTFSQERMMCLNALRKQLSLALRLFLWVHLPPTC